VWRVKSGEWSSREPRFFTETRIDIEIKKVDFENEVGFAITPLSTLNTPL